MEAETQPEEESSAVMLGDIDLNSASSSQFQQLRGVGPATASSIIEYREQNGSFSSVDELNNVSGIGPATLKKMKAAAGMEVEESSEPTASTTGSGDININTASNSQLQNITGVGPSTAGSIIEYREQNGPFGSVEELTNVSGIGAKTLEKMKPQITVGE
jgi:competence ComEA-like helix-hairpin-helix protein